MLIVDSYEEGHPDISTFDTSVTSVVLEVSSGLVEVTTPTNARGPSNLAQRVQRGSLQVRRRLTAPENCVAVAIERDVLAFQLLGIVLHGRVGAILCWFDR